MPSIYRLIYEKHYGSIPVDESGVTYDIHHIDGNRKNNEISNLKAVTLQEHYDIHFNQGDWMACQRILKRMNDDPVKKSILLSKSNKERVENGTHNWLGDGCPWKNKEKARERELKKLAEGKHPSQMKKTCPHCERIISVTCYSKHVRSCIDNPNRVVIKYNMNKETK